MVHIVTVVVAIMLAAAAAEAQPAPVYAVAEISPGSASAEAEDGAVRVVLSTVAPVEGDDSDAPKPFVEIYHGGELVAAKLADGSDGPPFARAAIVDLDRAHPGKEVVFDVWTGGAHCCAEVSMASPGEGDIWTFHNAGTFDVGIDLLDLDGDGRLEISARDDAFAYAFGGYLATVAPLKVVVFEDGAFRDASRDPRFIDAHRARLEEFRARIEEGDGPLDNAFLAGWVAMKILVGEGDEAWQTMLRRHDPNDDGGLEACLRQEADLSCKPENLVTRTFPEALKTFLDDNGYVF